MSLLGEGGAAAAAAGGNTGAGAGDAGGAAAASGAASGGAASGATATTGTASWRDALPEEMRGNATLSKFSDIPALAKSYVELQGVVGKKGVFPPGEKATPEQWKEFAKSIGQPELDKFEVKIPEGKKVNSEMVAGFKKLAHESGLLPHQAQQVHDWYIAQEEAAIAADQSQSAAQVQAGIDGLKKEWGAGFDKEIAKAKLAAKELGVDVDKYGNNIDIIKALAKAGALYGEDKLRGDGSGKFGETPNEIQAQIDSVMGNLKHPYFDASHSGHQAAKRQMEELYKKRYPTPA